MSRGRRISRVKLIHPTPSQKETYFIEWEGKELFNSPERFPKISGENLFGKDQGIHLEIGCGTGEYIVALAAEHSDQYFVGIEISRRSIYQAIQSAAKEKLSNLKFIKADFHLLYPLLAPNSIQKAYFHFPDPNYGKKRIKHRIFTDRFLDALHQALVTEGKISVVTDQEPLFRDMQEIIALHPEFSFKRSTTFTAKDKSRFQQAWERAERPPIHFYLQKQ